MNDLMLARSVAAAPCPSSRRCRPPRSPLGPALLLALASLLGACGQKGPLLPAAATPSPAAASAPVR